MTDASPRAPRRAITPLPEDDFSPDELSPSEASRPSRASWTAVGDRWDSDNEELVNTGSRFYLFPDEIESPTTPVPPPAPVLPVTGPADIPASAGRRFSTASPGTANTTAYVPRRSAASVASPPSPWSPAGPSRRAAEPTATRPDLAAQTREVAAGTVRHLKDVQSTLSRFATQHAAQRRLHAWFRWLRLRARQLSRRAWIAVAGVTALVLVIVVILAGLGGGGTVSPSEASTLLADTQLLSAQDLNGALPGTNWRIKDTVTKLVSTSPQPKCLLTAADGQPAAPAAAVRTLENSTGTSAAALTMLEAYADGNRAHTAYALRLGQLGTCARTTAFILSGFDLSGLADEAAGITVVLQDQAVEYHTLVLSRTGRLVSVVDVAQGSAPAAMNDLVKAVSTALARQCSATGGTCPSGLKVTPSAPPAAGLLGWLNEADLPRITLGAGRWSGTDPSSNLTVIGSLCESVDLRNPPSATGKLQRTYLISGDNAAPSSFGLDEAVYTFANADEAAAFGRLLASNISGCAKPNSTATVTGLPTVTSVGSGGAQLTANAWTITQKVSDVKSILFRVSVAVVNNRVSYLLANPATNYNLTDAQWQIVAIRSAERLSQSV